MVLNSLTLATISDAMDDWKKAKNTRRARRYPVGVSSKTTPNTQQTITLKPVESDETGNTGDRFISEKHTKLKGDTRSQSSSPVGKREQDLDSQSESPPGNRRQRPILQRWLDWVKSRIRIKRYSLDG